MRSAGTLQENLEQSTLYRCKPPARLFNARCGARCEKFHVEQRFHTHGLLSESAAPWQFVRLVSRMARIRLELSFLATGSLDLTGRSLATAAASNGSAGFSSTKNESTGKKLREGRDTHAQQRRKHDGQS